MRRTRNPKNEATSRRRGAVLVWFAVFLFVLIPLLALVIDQGLVILARRQMQAAVNSAALEGLRTRDDSSLGNSQRRQKVRSLVSAIFDDDLDDAADPMNFGAGSSIAFDAESTDLEIPGTDFKASRTIRAANVGVYKPDLQPNLDNDLHGDIVFGHYDVSATAHGERDDYTRDDFDLSADDAVLVRLRRTDRSEAGAPLNDLEAGVSSSGPTLPSLFGRGPFTRAPFLSHREYGTVARATAIAHAELAMTVGLSSPAVPEGVAPLWIERDRWNSLATNVAAGLSGAGTSINVAGLPAGETVVPQLTSVGDGLSAGLLVAPLVNEIRFVPIYQEVSAVRRVIGFGAATISIESTAGVISGTITRRPSAVGPRNVSTAWRGSLGTASPSDILALMLARESLNEPLLAPALRRVVD